MGTNPFRAVIFDLDGVLVDTVPLQYQAWKTLATEIGVSLTLTENEHFKGSPRAKCVDLLTSKLDKTLTNNDKRQLATRKNEIYLRLLEKLDENDILPGVLPLLNELSAYGIPIAVGSASTNAHTVLARTTLDEYFDIVVDGTMVTHGKPHPEVFLSCAAELCTPSDLCLVFEDSHHGIQAAKAASMQAIGVGNETLISVTDHYVSDLTQLNLHSEKPNEYRITYERRYS